MGTRNEVERVGMGLASAGVAYLGTYLALFIMGFVDPNSGVLVALSAALLVLVPAAIVLTILPVLGRFTSFPLHPIATALGTAVGGLLSFPFFQIFGLLGLTVMPALLTYATFMVAQFLLNRPTLSGADIGIDAAGTLLFYSWFAAYPLAIVMGWVDTTGCEGCGRTPNLITTAFLFGLALLVIGLAATRYGRGDRAVSRAIDTGVGP